MEWIMVGSIGSVNEEQPNPAYRNGYGLVRIGLGLPARPLPGPV